MSSIPPLAAGLLVPPLKALPAIGILYTANTTAYNAGNPGVVGPALGPILPFWERCLGENNDLTRFDTSGTPAVSVVEAWDNPRAIGPAELIHKNLVIAPAGVVPIVLPPDTAAANVYLSDVQQWFQRQFIPYVAVLGMSRDLAEAAKIALSTEVVPVAAAGGFPFGMRLTTVPLRTSLLLMYLWFLREDLAVRRPFAQEYYHACLVSEMTQLNCTPAGVASLSWTNTSNLNNFQPIPWSRVANIDQTSFASLAWRLEGCFIAMKTKMMADPVGMNFLSQWSFSATAGGPGLLGGASKPRKPKKPTKPSKSPVTPKKKKKPAPRPPPVPTHRW